MPYCPFHKGLSVCVAALLFKKQRHSLICAALASSADPLRVSANSVLLLWHKPFCICHAASVWSLCQKTLASVTQPQCCHSDTNPFASVMQPQCGHFAKKSLHLSRRPPLLPWAHSDSGVTWWAWACCTTCTTRCGCELCVILCGCALTYVCGLAVLLVQPGVGVSCV